MECDKIREIILTDHADGRVSADVRASVERHTAGCPGCRELLNSVRMNDKLLNDLPSVRPPQFVWDNILSTIEQRPESLLEKVSAALKGWAFAPRRTFAVSMALVTVIIVAGALRTMDNRSAARTEAVNATVLLSLTADPGEFVSGFGTAAENFLEI